MYFWGRQKARTRYLESALSHIPPSKNGYSRSPESPERTSRKVFAVILLAGFLTLLVVAVLDSERRAFWVVVMLASLLVLILSSRNLVLRKLGSLSLRKLGFNKLNLVTLRESSTFLENPLLTRRDKFEESAKRLGHEIGRKLAFQYRQAAEHDSDGKHPLKLYDLIPDVEKDLNPALLSKQFPTGSWLMHSRVLGPKTLLNLVRESAVDSFMDLASRWETSSSASAQGVRTESISKPTQQKPPGIRLHLDPTAFEAYCVEWSKYLGYKDAEATRAVKDGGIDIFSSRMVAQCKYQELPVGVKPIRELFGLSQARKKKPLFFSLNGYTREAIREAEQFDVEMWVVRPLDGTIERVQSFEQMNQGDYHSGPEGYSANLGYPDTQYGSMFNEDADWHNG